MRWEELVQAWVSISLSYVLYIMYLEEVGHWHCTHANLIALLIPGVHFGVLVKRRERPVAVFQMIILKQVRSGAKTWIIRRCSCGWDEWPKFDFFTSVMILFHFSFSFPSLWRHRHGMHFHFSPLELICFLIASLSHILLCPQNLFFPGNANCMFISENVNTLNDEP